MTNLPPWAQQTQPAQPQQQPPQQPVQQPQQQSPQQVPPQQAPAQPVQGVTQGGAPAWAGQVDVSNPTSVHQAMDTGKKGGKKEWGPRRFFLKKGSKARIIFLSTMTGEGRPISIYEHNPQTPEGSPQKWMNWCSCLKMIGMPCDLCDYAQQHNNGAAYRVLLFSIIDTTEWTTKKGEVVRNEKKILPSKSNSAEIISRRCNSLHENGYDLRGAMFDVYRSNNEHSPSVGDDFQYVGHANLADYPDTAVHDWNSLVAPDPQKVQALLAKLQGGQGGGQQVQQFAQNQQNVPF